MTSRAHVDGCFAQIVYYVGGSEHERCIALNSLASFRFDRENGLSMCKVPMSVGCRLCMAQTISAREMHLSASPPQLHVIQSLFRFRYSYLDTISLLLDLQLVCEGLQCHRRLRPWSNSRLRVAVTQSWCIRLWPSIFAHYKAQSVPRSSLTSQQLRLAFKLTCPLAASCSCFSLRRFPPLHNASLSSTKSGYGHLSPAG